MRSDSEGVQSTSLHCEKYKNTKQHLTAPDSTWQHLTWQYKSTPSSHAEKASAFWILAADASSWHKKKSAESFAGRRSSRSFAGPARQVVSISQAASWARDKVTKKLSTCRFVSDWISCPFFRQWHDARCQLRSIHRPIHSTEGVVSFPYRLRLRLRRLRLSLRLRSPLFLSLLPPAMHVLWMRMATFGTTDPCTDPESRININGFLITGHIYICRLLTRKMRRRSKIRSPPSCIVQKSKVTWCHN